MWSVRQHLVSVCVLVLGAVTSGTGISRAADTGAPSTVVAKQGDAIITLTDIDAFAQTIPKEQRSGFFDSPKRLESVITTLLLKKQLAAEAQKLGLDKDPAVIAQIHLAEEDVLSSVRMERFKEDVKLPNLDQLAKETYIGNKSKYVVPGKLDVKHILISTKERSEAEAKELADKVEKEVRANPDQFDALVEKYSDDPSKTTNKGLMPNAGSDQYQAPFAEASRALKKAGDISPLVETSYGFHIIKLVERTPDRQQSFEEVRDQILKKLRADYVEKAVRGHTDQIRGQPVDANPELVASLRTRFGSPERTSPAAKAGEEASK